MKKLKNNVISRKGLLKKQEKQEKQRKRGFTRSGIFLSSFLSLFFFSSVSFAAGSTKIDTVLQNLLDYLTSTPARILAVLAVIGVGFGTLHLGKIPKGTAIAVVVGIGIIFGGASIIQMLGVA